MRCSACEKNIYDYMNFCPYCGAQIGQIVVESLNYEERETIEAMFLNEKFDDLLEYALSGNNFAQTYYVRKIKSVACERETTDHNKYVKQLKEKKDNPFAMAALGIFYYHHAHHTVFDYQKDDLLSESRKWTFSASKKKDSFAIALVAEWLFTGENADKDVITAYEFSKKAAEMGCSMAMLNLGLWHSEGREGISKNQVLGREYIEKAAFLGDFTARTMLSKENNKWFEEDLVFSVSNESLFDIKRLVSPNVWDEKEAGLKALRNQYDNCINADQLINFYIELRSHFKDNKGAELLYKWLEQYLCNILGLELNGKSVDDTIRINEQLNEAKKVVAKYTKPQHFLHLRSDLKRLSLDFDEETLKKLFDDVSITLQEKCTKEKTAYLKYLSDGGKDKDLKIRNLFIAFLFLLLITVVLWMFSKILGIIATGFMVLWIISVTSQKRNYKKAQKLKDDYQLINALIGYGYTPIILDGTEIKFDETVEYINKVPSVIS